jgi:hypothetical protein
VTRFDELTALVEALDRAGIEYALVGGLAVAVWGAPRATGDIDLLARGDALPAALDVARRLGFTTRALPKRFADGMELQRVSKADAGRQLVLDLILVNASLEPVWRTRRHVAIEGGARWVVSRSGLIQLTVAAGRTQDLADVERLQALDR